MPKKGHFQAMLSGSWKDYEKEEDGILKRVFMSGHKTAKYSLRGYHYEYDFARMKQKNVESGKERDIRAPYKWKRPSKPIVPAGPTMVVKVPPGGSGTVIQVPHPMKKSLSIAVEVPSTAKVGAAMMVPVPPLPDGDAPGEPVAAPDVSGGDGGAAPPQEEDEKKSGMSAGETAGGDGGAAPPQEDKKKSSMSAGETAGFAVGGAALIGGMAVAGAMIGDAAADGAFDGAIDAAGGAAADAGDILGDAAGDADDWLMDVGADAGDFIMDLF